MTNTAPELENRSPEPVTMNSETRSREIGNPGHINSESPVTTRRNTHGGNTPAWKFAQAEAQSASMVESTQTPLWRTPEICLMELAAQRIINDGCVGFSC